MQPHVYSTWLAPDTPVYGSDPDVSAHYSEGKLPRDIFVLVKHQFPEPKEFYVQARVDEMRKVLGPDHVIRIGETIYAGDVQLYDGSEVYISKEFAISKDRVKAPDVHQSLMERLL